MALTSAYNCADGSGFVVEWDDRADAEKRWVMEPEDFLLPFLPVEAEAFTHALVGHVESALAWESPW